MGKLQITNYKLQIFSVFLFTLLLLFLLTSHFSPLTSIHAQSPKPAPRATLKRLNALEDYLKNSVRFKNLTGDKQKKSYQAYLSFLQKAVEADKSCYSQRDSQAKQQRKVCDDQIKADYKKAKQFNRLLKYYLVEQKTAFVCVKADLGIGKPLEARGIANPALFATASATAKETGRTKPSQVFLCTGEAGQKKLRVQAANGHMVKLTPQDLARTELQLSTLPPSGNLTELEGKLGISIK